MRIIFDDWYKRNFNPRSRKGFDVAWLWILSAAVHFNPRSRKGFDFKWNNLPDTVSISIHEAAKASTRCYFHFWFRPEFQSTKPQRLRLQASLNEMLTYLFQSTKPQRLRHERPSNQNQPKRDFNPRSRKGFDATPYLDNSVHGEFQSTKPQRLRRRGENMRGHITNFNPRSRKGFDRLPIKALLFRKEFQSTKPQRLRQQKHPKNNLIFKNNLYTYYNIPAHNNYILIILNLFTIKSTIFQVRISRDFHVHFLFAPNNSILKYHN